MGRKTKYSYDINIIERLENSFDYSIREIARLNGWPEIGTQAWINRHYDKEVSKTVRYIKKRDSND